MAQNPSSEDNISSVTLRIFSLSRKFISVGTTDGYFSLPAARWIRFTPSYTIFLRSILILSFHLSVGISSGSFTFPNKILYPFSSYPHCHIPRRVLQPLLILRHSFPIWPTYSHCNPKVATKHLILMFTAHLLFGTLHNNINTPHLTNHMSSIWTGFCFSLYYFKFFDMYYLTPSSSIYNVLNVINVPSVFFISPVFPTFFLSEFIFLFILSRNLVLSATVFPFKI